jgi:hypothetical protein
VHPSHAPVSDATGGNRTRDRPVDNRPLCHSATATKPSAFCLLPSAFCQAEGGGIEPPTHLSARRPASNRVHYRSANPPTDTRMATRALPERRVRESNPQGTCAPCLFSRQVPYQLGEPSGFVDRDEDESLSLLMSVSVLQRCGKDSNLHPPASEAGAPSD